VTDCIRVRGPVYVLHSVPPDSKQDLKAGSIEMKGNARTVVAGVSLLGVIALAGYLRQPQVVSDQGIGQEIPEVVATGFDDQVPQHFSCGPASLYAAVQQIDEAAASRLLDAMVANEYPQRSITSFQDLSLLAKDAGLGSIGLRIDDSDLGEIPLPAIVHFDPNHFVTLVSVEDDRVAVIDAGSITRNLPRPTFEARFSGSVLCFTDLDQD
jgi:peptidase C39-like protein